MKINKEFCTYKQALALKELEFDEPCFNRFYTKPQSKMFGVDEKGRHYPIKNTSKKLYTMGEYFVLNDSNVILAPLYQQAFRFFREKHNLQAEMVFSEKPDRFYYYIGNMVTGDMDRGTDMSYEEAEQACLDELIEIIKL